MKKVRDALKRTNSIERFPSMKQHHAIVNALHMASDRAKMCSCNNCVTLEAMTLADALTLYENSLSNSSASVAATRAIARQEAQRKRGENIYHLRYNEKQTFSQIGDAIGVSGERVRQLLFQYEQEEKR